MENGFELVCGWKNDYTLVSTLPLTLYHYEILMTTYNLLKRICCIAVIVLTGASSNAASPPPTKSTVAKQFERALEDEIGKRWYAMIGPYTKQLHADSIRVYFHVSRDRQLHVRRVTPNKPHDLLTKLTLEAFTQVKAPPIPQELLSTPNQLDDVLGFEFYQH